jgi:hypothetical protein
MWNSSSCGRLFPQTNAFTGEEISMSTKKTQTDRICEHIKNPGKGYLNKFKLITPEEIERLRKQKAQIEKDWLDAIINRELEQILLKGEE